MGCRCQLHRDLDRQQRMVEQQLADAREALRFELALDERLALVVEEHELLALLRRIEERAFALSA
jgi:hypothetical protein